MKLRAAFFCLFWILLQSVFWFDDSQAGAGARQLTPSTLHLTPSRCATPRFPKGAMSRAARTQMMANRDLLAGFGRRIEDDAFRRASLPPECLHRAAQRQLRVEMSQTCRHLANAVCDFAKRRCLKSHTELYRCAKNKWQRVALDCECVEEVRWVRIAKCEESFLLTIHVVKNRNVIFRIDSKQALRSGDSKDFRYIRITVTALYRFV
jgi:hypothetical protein